MKPRDVADNMLERVITSSDSLMELLKLDTDISKRKELTREKRKYYQDMAGARAGYLMRKRISKLIDYFK